MRCTADCWDQAVFVAGTVLWLLPSGALDPAAWHGQTAKHRFRTPAPACLAASTTIRRPPGICAGRWLSDHGLRRPGDWSEDHVQFVRLSREGVPPRFPAGLDRRVRNRQAPWRRLRVVGTVKTAGMEPASANRHSARQSDGRHQATPIRRRNLLINQAGPTSR